MAIWPVVSALCEAERHDGEGVVQQSCLPRGGQEEGRARVPISPSRSTAVT